MIPYHIYGHSKGDNYSEPIVWLDSSDTDSYVLNNPELVTNGDFSNGLNSWATNSNASASVVNGLARVEVVASASGYLFQNVTGLQAGKTYSITANGYVGTSTKISLYTAKNGFNDLTNDGVINVTFTASDSDEVIRLYTYGNGTYGEWDNISVKEVSPDAQEVTSIDNLGTLGGQFDLFGNVKFANNGFEGWNTSDYINYDLLEPFLPSNSFTMVTTFNLQDLTTGANSNNQLFSTLKALNENYYVISGRGVIGGNVSISAFVFLSDVFTFYVNNPLNIQTLIVGWDNVSKKMYALNTDGTYLEQAQNTDFNNNSNAVISLLGNVFNQNTGKDNPLFEFKLYDKTFTLTEMQELQIELNNKYL